MIGPNGVPKGATLLTYSWWGLTDSLRAFGSAFSDAGYLVGLADLFDGKTVESEADARALRAAPRRIPFYKRLDKDIAALRAGVGHAGVRFGVVGLSMGEHWAVWLSQRPEYNIAATVLYYAARAGDFSDCRSDIIAHFAERNPWVSAIARKTMKRAIDKSGCAYLACDYSKTQHWFAESSQTAEFGKSAARLDLHRDLGHFERNLGVSGEDNCGA